MKPSQQPAAIPYVPPRERGRRRKFATLTVAALGIVFGDIGTSPLYALRECFYGPHAVAPTPANVLGVLSLIFWALIVIVSVKYLIFIMRADNDGEGGVLALVALLDPWRQPDRRLSRGLLGMGLIGAALLYSDSIITPAISVLSAIEGLEATTHGLHAYVMPIAIVILLGLFFVQQYGTARVAAAFAPVMLLWFASLAILGAQGIAMAPEVLRALNPARAVDFFVGNDGFAFIVLGAVFLAVTGGEALYADMGHFGRQPIRLAWFGLVLPALLLNYFGQGAEILLRPEQTRHPFYDLAPDALRYPLVILAAAAAAIASQAVISGAFSLTRQAVQLNQWPRLNIVQTSARQAGQIYIPLVNGFMMAGTVGLVLGFGSSSALAGAYGLAVNLTMLVTTVLAYYVVRQRWRWPLMLALPVTATLLALDFIFLSANALKIDDGGWLPLLIAAGLFLVMATWNRGREQLAARRARLSQPVAAFIEDVERLQPLRVPGTAAFLTNADTGVPANLVHHLKRYPALHRQVIFLTVVTAEVPYVSSVRRLEIKPLGAGFWRVVLHYGFMESPDVPNDLRLCEELGVLPNLREREVTYYLGRTTVVPSRQVPGMALWRERMFAFLARNSLNATAFYHLPPARVVEIGMYVEV